MTELLVHASCVAVDGRAVLIRGPSGSGKSSLALQLIAIGATLVADDQTRLVRQGSKILASCPETGRGLIEARFIGILRTAAVAQAEVAVVVDLSVTETDRLPPARQCDLLGIKVDLVQRVSADHFPSALMCYLRERRYD